jgi:glucosylceramidase
MLTVSRLKIFVCIILAAVFFVPSSSGQTAEVYVSSKGGDRLAHKSDITFQQAGSPGGATFEVNDSVKYQKMDGFGASLLEAGIIVLNSLPADQQEAVLRSLFDSKDGAGFTAMKTEITKA